MKTIKLRAWDKEKKVMITCTRDVLQLLLTPYKPRYIIMQSIELLDKKHKEIYEEDVVKFDNQIYGIDYLGGCYRLVNKNGAKVIGMDINSFMCEIIGNEFENPKLLKF